MTTPATETPVAPAPVATETTAAPVPAPVTPAVPAVAVPAAPPTPPPVAAPAAPVVPETYAAFATPEGYALDAGLVERAAPVFKGLGLTQEQAQKLVDFQISDLKEQEAAAVAERASWTAALKADPEIGGANFEANIVKARGIAQRVLGVEQAQALLALGDWPPLVKLLHGIAKRTAEDTFGAGPRPDGASPVQTQDQKLRNLYPNSPGMFGPAGN